MTSPSKHRELVHTQLSRFKRLELRTADGALVTDRKHALAIALAMAERDAPAQASQGPRRKVLASGKVKDRVGGEAQAAERGQLLLLPAEPAAAAGDHVWRYCGTELRAPHKGAQLFRCDYCSAHKRVQPRGARAFVSYSSDAEFYVAARPVCRRAPGRGGT